jgi:murein DD-endopeptidase MepM/ murein hydrolase activator NlpD
VQRFSNLLVVFLISFSLGACVTFDDRNQVEASKPSVHSAKPRLNLVSPVTTRYRVTQRYRPRRNRKHQGIDLAGKKGSPIFSAGDGRVVYVGRRFTGYGKMILIDHGKGVATLYSHLNKYFVRSGQVVHRRQLIGTMGRTGRATGVHLHFEVMEDKIPINPEKYIRF